MNLWLRYLGLCVTLVFSGCAPEFPEAQPASIFSFSPNEDAATQSRDALIVPDAGMLPDVAFPDGGTVGHRGMPDDLEYFGVCDRTILIEDELLSNDALTPELRAALNEERPGYEVVITQQPQHGRVFSNDREVIEFEPSDVEQVTFQYAIRTPTGDSPPTTVTVRQPSGAVAITPAANEGAADGLCSLREAIQVANDGRIRNDCGTRPAEQVVIVFAERGTISLSRVGPDDDEAQTGDLDIHGDVTIIGCSAATTRITSEYRSRVFEVHRGARLALHRLSISRGQASIGGGLLNRGDVELNDVSFFANSAVGEDGEPGELAGGCGGGGGAAGIGGAIATMDGSTTIVNSPSGDCSFEQNKAQGGNGGASINGAARHADGIGIRNYCGGKGGGLNGGAGGQVQGQGRTDGGAGEGVSGGGGGGGGLDRIAAGAGGPGGFGAGGGGGGNTPSQNDPMPGPGGYAGGSGAPGPLDAIGGGGGGGAALGGAVAILGGSLQLTGCTFTRNRLIPGDGGGSDRQDLSSQRGRPGRQYGKAVFSIGNLIDIRDSGAPDWVSCEEVEAQFAQQCRPLDL